MPSSRKGHRKPSTKRTRIAPPLVLLTPEKKGKEYVWPDFKVKSVANKGGTQGLFAARDLPANTRFVYYGKRINQKQYEKLWEEAKKHPETKGLMASYIADCPGKLTCLVDANPRLAPSRQGVALKGLAIGGKVNEPAVGETENAWFTEVKDSKGKRWPGLVLIRPVKKGEEILAHYGPDYSRPYKVGKAHTSEPWWFSL